MPRATQTATLPGMGAPGDTLDAALAAFRAHGEVARQMIARLDGMLDRLEVIPIEDGERWSTGTALYGALRHGEVPRPLAPHIWPWPLGVRGWEVAAFPLAIRCRAAYEALDATGRDAATYRYGRLKGVGIDFSPLWRYGWPRDALRALDGRARALRVGWVPPARYADEEAPKRGARRSKRKALAGVA